MVADGGVMGISAMHICYTAHTSDGNGKSQTCDVLVIYACMQAHARCKQMHTPARLRAWTCLSWCTHVSAHVVEQQAHELELIDENSAACTGRIEI